MVTVGELRRKLSHLVSDEDEGVALRPDQVVVKQEYIDDLGEDIDHLTICGRSYAA